MKTNLYFWALIILAIITIACPFFCKDFASIISSVTSAVSLIISALAYGKSEKNSDELDIALKIKRGKDGIVEDLTIDGGTF